MKKALYTLAALLVITGAFYGYQVAKADIFGSSLIAWFTFDSNDISGTTVTDNSGTGNTGTTAGSPTAVNGMLGQALSFNGSSQYVSTNPTITGGTSGPGITVSMWIYPVTLAGVQYGIAVKKGATTPIDPSNLDWILVIDATKKVLAYDGAAYHGGNQILATGKWYLITWVRNINDTNFGASVDTIYINGVKDSTWTNDSNTETAGRTVYVAAGYSHYFIGYVDDFRIYNNHPFTAAEASQLWYNTRGSHGYSSF